MKIEDLQSELDSLIRQQRHVQEYLDDRNYKKFVQLMLPKVHLGKGLCFGELALMETNKNKARAASVICIEAC